MKQNDKQMVVATIIGQINYGCIEKGSSMWYFASDLISVIEAIPEDITHPAPIKLDDEQRQKIFDHFSLTYGIEIMDDDFNQIDNISHSTPCEITHKETILNNR